MSHDHDQHGASGNIGVAFFLNLTFTIIELVGGLWTNSIAILSDALHDFGDCITLGFAWYLQRISRRPGDYTFTYGYRRFSALGAFITGVVLLVGLLFIVWNSATRLFSPQPVYAPGMIAIAIVGIVFNGVAVLRVRGGSSLNEKVMSWHLLEDVLGWAAVLIGSIVMLIWDVPIIDPLLSIGISLFVLWNVIKNLRKVFMVFMQSAPKSFDPARFRKAVTAIEGAVSNHHTHVWSIDGEHHVLSTHLVMQPKAKRDEIIAAKRRIHELLKRHKFEHVTIDVELEGEECTAEEDDAHADAAKK